MPTVVTGVDASYGRHEPQRRQWQPGHTVLLVALHHRHAARNAPGVQIVTGATLLAGGGKAGLYIPSRRAPTVIPKGASSLRRAQVKLSTAALVAE